MNKKGVALIVSIFVVTVVMILAAAIFLKSTNESNLVRRRILSMRAFWLAEAGIAEGVKNMSHAITMSVALNAEYCSSPHSPYSFKVVGNDYVLRDFDPR